MSNNVKHVHFGTRPPPAVDEPTELQRAVLARARELRQREHEPRTRSPMQWAMAGALAVVCFAIMFGAVDAVARKMQLLTKEYGSQPTAPTVVVPASQSQSPTQPYFIDLQQASGSEAR